MIQLSNNPKQHCKHKQFMLLLENIISQKINNFCKKYHRNNSS